MRGVKRESKFNNAYVEPAKKELWYSGLRPVFEGNRHHITANSEYFAFSGAGGGGPVYVQNFNEPGRGSGNPPKIMVHKGKVVDLAFNPFDNNILATASEDATVKISKIPEGGLKADTTQSIASLDGNDGHSKSLSTILFHPTASNVLASASADKSLKLWDIETQTMNVGMDDHTDTPFSVAFNTDGSLMASTCKDRKLRLFDPRSGGSVQTTDGLGGTKASEVLFADNLGLLIQTGFNKGSMRQWSVYDPRNFSKPCKTADIDASAGVVCSYYDPDLSLLYITGKGDAKISMLEMTNDGEYGYSVGIGYADNTAHKGFTMVPKIAMNTPKCEIARGLRLLGDMMIPVSIIVPRKTDLFQPDIYPDTYAYKSSGSAKDYFGGANPARLTQSMDPKKSGNALKAAASPASKPVNQAAAGAPVSAPVSAPAPARNPAPAPAAKDDSVALREEIANLKEQLSKAHAHIADLESQLASFQN